MKPRNPRLAAALAVILALPLAAAVAGADADWNRLGTRRVTDRNDHDEIHVGAAEGRISALQLRAERSAVHVRRIVVHYANGDDQPIDRDFIVPKGGRGPILDLDGGDRIVRRVSFFYEAESFGRRGATVELWGRR